MVLFIQVTCLVSGGKDSVLALWVALHKYEVQSIVTIQTEKSDSYLFHIPNSRHVGLIATMLKIPHLTAYSNDNNPNRELMVLKDILEETKAEAVITGGIRSDFQRYKFNRAAKLAGMKCFNPLWRLKPEKLISEFLTNNFNVIFVAVASMGFSKDLLGKKITFETLERIRKNMPGTDLSLTGEGGEYESFVLDAPFFPSEIRILRSKVHWDETREEGSYEILEAKLVEKDSYFR